MFSTKKILAVLSLILVLFPEGADGQVIFLNYGGFGRSNYPPVASPYSYGLGSTNRGWGGYYGGYSSPYYSASPIPFGRWGNAPAWYSYSGPMVLPGFAANETAPRLRTTLAPALGMPVDSPLLAASYLGAEKKESPAHLEILVPTSDAQLWLEGVAMTQKGTQRWFVTPPLQPEKKYAYEVRLRWRDQAGDHEHTQTVSIQAGQNRMVDLTRPRSEKAK